MPDLAEISAALFGDLVDVSKMDPGVSDVHSFGGSNRAVLIPRPTGRRRVRKLDDRTKRQATAGLSVVGATAGLYGLGLGANHVLGEGYKAHPMGPLPKAARTGWKATPKKSKYLIPIEAAGLTGELASARILHRDAQRTKPVEKGMPELVNGFLHNSRFMTALHAPEVVSGTKQFGEHVPDLTRRAEKQGMINANRNPATRSLVQARGGHQGAYEHLNQLRTRRTGRMAERAVAKPPIKTPTERAIAAGQNARADFNTFAGTTSGKVALGATGLVAARGAFRHRREQVGDPYAAYAKRDGDQVTFTGTFSKFDDDKRLAFGWANVSKLNGIPVVDRQGDYVAIEDIEDAAYHYVKHSRVGGDMHRRVGGKSVGTIDRPHQVATLVESMVFDDAKCDALGLPEEFPRGWWIGMHVDDDEAWEMAKDGRRTGFSIHGKGIRKSVDYDSLMGY